MMLRRLLRRLLEDSAPHLATMQVVTSTTPTLAGGGSPTTRIGPASSIWDMRTLEFGEGVDPMADGAVQRLLTEGWEPWGVHRVEGDWADGVRLYFKRPHVEVR
jgi:hypothetical protein